MVQLKISPSPLLCIIWKKPNFSSGNWPEGNIYIYVDHSRRKLASWHPSTAIYSYTKIQFLRACLLCCNCFFFVLICCSLFLIVPQKFLCCALEHALCMSMQVYDIYTQRKTRLRNRLGLLIVQKNMAQCASIYLGNKDTFSPSCWQPLVKV